MYVFIKNVFKNSRIALFVHPSVLSWDFKTSQEFKVSRTVGCWLQKLLQLLTSNRLQLLTNSILPEFVGPRICWPKILKMLSHLILQYVNILSLWPCFRCEVLPWPDTFPQYGFYGPCDFSFVVSSVPGKLGPNSWAPEPNWPLLKTVKFILFILL